MRTILILTFFLSSLIYANQDSTYSYVQVYKTEPIYEYRTKKVYEQCEKEYYKDTNVLENSVGLDTIVGATIGVAIGNQIGKGNGKDVAKVVGGILGATMANNTRNYRNNTYNNSCDKAYYTTRQEEVLVGYKNYFVYDNQTYTKITKRPKRQIRVTRTISF